jgi:hypothetical protein
MAITPAIGASQKVKGEFTVNEVNAGSVIDI